MCDQSIVDVLLANCVQCFGYMTLAVYLDKALPDRMGVRLPPWYPLLPAYWNPPKVSLLLTFPLFRNQCVSICDAHNLTPCHSNILLPSVYTYSKVAQSKQQMSSRECTVMKGAWHGSVVAIT